MKLLITSDSHGNKAHLRYAIGQEKPDAVFHLGDGRQDILTVSADYPGLPLFSVAGNCDWHSRQPSVNECIVEGVRFFYTHGHPYRVKNGYYALIQAGRRAGARVVLSGHTHAPCIWEDQGILLMNPGTIGNGAHPTYGIIEVSGGQVEDARIQKIDKPIYEWNSI